MDDKQDISHDVLLEEYMEDNDLVIGDLYEVVKEGFYVNHKTRYQQSLPKGVIGKLLKVDYRRDIAILEIKSQVECLNGVFGIININDIIRINDGIKN